MTRFSEHRFMEADTNFYSKYLDGVYQELEESDLPTSGKLCEDIDAHGYDGHVAMTILFEKRAREVDRLRHEMAARVCESCVFWLKCPDLRLGSISIDEEQRFGLRPEADWNSPIINPTLVAKRAELAEQMKWFALSKAPVVEIKKSATDRADDDEDSEESLQHTA